MFTAEEQQLIDVAGQNACACMIQRLLMHGRRKEAKATLKKCIELNRCSRELDMAIYGEVRLALAHEDLERAEQLVAARTA